MPRDARACQEAALARKYVPNGPFPQLMWFQHGEPTQYHRRRATPSAASGARTRRTSEQTERDVSASASMPHARRRLRKTDRIVDFALSLDRIPITEVAGGEGAGPRACAHLWVEIWQL